MELVEADSQLDADGRGWTVEMARLSLRRQAEVAAARLAASGSSRALGAPPAPCG